MSVSILGDNGQQLQSKIAFLKLFDRRFSKQLREDNGISKWAKELEIAYVQSIKSGSIFRFLEDLHSIPNFQDDTEEDWDDAENETFLTDELHRLFTTEAATYEKLHTHQGRVIPKLLAQVEMDIAPPGLSVLPASPGGFEPFKIKGLLQHVDGFNLWDIVQHCPRSSWQAIVDQAVSAVRILGDHDILNQDVRPENFVIQARTGGNKEVEDYHVFMVDFALCRFRGENESDADWGKAKNTKDEEGAVGLRMKKLLKEKHHFDLHFEASHRYEQWGDTDDSFKDRAFKRQVGPGEFVYTLRG